MLKPPLSIVESLESRRLLSANLVDGQLRVDGSDDADTISLSRDGDEILVEVSGEDDERFNVSAVDSIRIRGLEGDDVIDVGRNLGRTTILGGDGADDISGGNARDRIRGGDGNDTLSGAKGDDDVRGGAGVDAVTGGDGDDTVTGGSSADAVFGGQGDDVVRGNADDDRLHGGEGADTIVGGTGDDRIFARDGNKDTLDGGDGVDTAEIDEGVDEVENIEDFVAQTFNFTAGLARISADDVGNTAEVVSFGGDGTTDVDVIRSDEGEYTVTFTGDYASVTSEEIVTPILTVVAGDGTAVSAAVQIVSADDGEIVLNVFTWNQVGADADQSFALAILIDPDATLEA